MCRRSSGFSCHSTRPLLRSNSRPARGGFWKLARTGSSVPLRSSAGGALPSARPAGERPGVAAVVPFECLSGPLAPERPLCEGGLCAAPERASPSETTATPAARTSTQTASARIRLRRRLASARARRERPLCGMNGEPVMYPLSSPWRIAQCPDDANRQDHQHDHRQHPLNAETKLLDPTDRQKREAKDERKRYGEHGDTGHSGLLVRDPTTLSLGRQPKGGS